MADLTGSPLRDVATAAAWWLTYRKSNDWREYPVEGWAVAVTEERAVPRDELLAHRALVVDGDAPIDRRIEATLALAETGPAAASSSGWRRRTGSCISCARRRAR
jgi:hypothetical protein